MIERYLSFLGVKRTHRRVDPEPPRTSPQKIDDLNHTGGRRVVAAVDARDPIPVKGFWFHCCSG